MSSLQSLIAQYEEGKHRIDEAIAHNRQRLAMETNWRRRLDLNHEPQILLSMRADLSYSIARMRRCLPDAELGE